MTHPRLKKPRPWVRPGKATVGKEWGWFHDDVLSFFPFWENAGVPRAYGRLNEQLQQQGTALWGDTPYGVGTSHTATDFFEFQNATYSSDYLGSAFTIFFTVFYDGSSAGFMYDDRDIAQGITVGFFGASADLTGVIEVSGGANVVPQYTPAIPAGLRTVCLRWDGADASISVDSDPGNPGTGSLSGTITLTDKRPRIGRGDVNQNIPVQAPNRILSASFFDTYRSDAEVLQVFQDPFGMARMRPNRFVVAAAFSSTNLAAFGSGASDIGGAIGSELTDDVLNNLWDDVTSGESSSGDTEFRCIYIKNTHATTTVTDAQVSVSADPTESDFALGLGAAGLNGTETEVADESTAPAGVSFGAGPLVLGTLAAGDFYPIWIRRTVQAGAGDATPDSGKVDIVADDPT